MVYFDKRVLLWYDAHLMMSLMHGPADNESAARFILAEQLMKVQFVVSKCAYCTQAYNSLMLINGN